MNRAKVLVADDHRIVAEGVRSLLAAEFDLAGVVEDGRALVEAAQRLHPDVIVADISMPVLNGIEALEALKRDGVNVPFVFLTMHWDASYALHALQAGAAGYILKHAAATELVQGLRAALDGRTFVSPAVADELSEAIGAGKTGELHAVSHLTQRQRDILRMCAAGLSAKEIAKKLGISFRTVEFHKYQAMTTLGAKCSAELIRLAIKHGIADP
jgi:DNA-binding NarL/FixJ family response regulator